MIIIISVCGCDGNIKGTVHGDPPTQSTCAVCGRAESYSMQVSSIDFGRVYRALADAGVLKPTLFPPKEPKETKEDEQQT